MRRDSFLKGAFVASSFVIFAKLLGFAYNIPFRAIIGTSGGSLYSQAYAAYEIFIVLSTVGIPSAISKITSEYAALGFFRTQRRVFYITRNIVTTFSLIFTLALFFLAPFIANAAIGEVKNSSYSQADLTFVIRTLSTALVFVAILGNMRGFLQGNRYITVSSSSQLLEQFARVSVILIGCFIAKNVLKLETTYTVAIAVFGATLGAIVSCFYLRRKISKEKILKPFGYKISEEEKCISKKFLTKKIILTTLPFVVVSLMDASYALVNGLTVTKTLVNQCKYLAKDAEAVYAFITNWGLTLNSIVTSIVMGISISVLPNLTKDLVSSDLEEVKKKIERTLKLVLAITIPAATGLSLLSGPVLGAFYGTGTGLEPMVFSFSVFVSIFSSFELNVTIIMQSLNKFKTTYIASIAGLVLNASLNVPFMLLFDKLNLGAYNGASFSTMVGLLVSSIINLTFLRKSHEVKYKEVARDVLISLSATLLMVFSILALKNVLPFETVNRLGCVFTIVIFTVIGMAIYLLVMTKTRCAERILGKDIFAKMILKFKSKVG